MSKFPNYRAVKITPKITAKVSPMKLHREESHRAMAAISVLMEGDTPGFMRVFQDVAAALRLSLKENHTQQEVDKIFDALGFSTEPYTPCFNAILALIGRDVRSQQNPKMQADDGAQWLRFRTICCREWGIPPWEFDVAWNLGKIDIGQVHSSVDLAILTAPDPEIIEEYIYPGSIQARAESMQEEQLAQSWAGLVAMKERNIER